MADAQRDEMADQRRRVGEAESATELHAVRGPGDRSRGIAGQGDVSA
jgi:hypothetical protein